MTLECEDTVCPYLSADTLDDIHDFNGAAPLQPFNALYQD
jgi:hypothetical protein